MNHPPPGLTAIITGYALGRRFCVILDGTLYVLIDEASNQWYGITDCFKSVGKHVNVATLDQSIYMVGGRTDYVNLSASIIHWTGGQTFDEYPAMMSVARSAMTSIVSKDGSKWYLFGGYDSNGSSQLGECYDFASQTMTQLSPLLEPRAAGAATEFGSDGRILVCGGEAETDTAYGFNITSCEIYNPRTNHWTRAADIPAELEQVFTIPISGGVLLFGVPTRHEIGLRMYFYDPSADS